MQNMQIEFSEASSSLLQQIHSLLMNRAARLFNHKRISESIICDVFICASLREMSIFARQKVNLTFLQVNILYAEIC